jgi:M6 family metalloprotease-like protein
MRFAVRLRALAGALVALLLVSGVLALDARADLLSPLHDLTPAAPDVPATPVAPTAAPVVAPVATGAATATAPAAKAAPPAAWGDLAPAFPGDLVVKQPDGSTFRAQLTGGEVGGALEVGGYSVTKRADGWWTYATSRQAGELVASAARVGLDARPAVAPHVGRTPNLWMKADGTDLRSQAFRQLQTAAWKASQEAAEAGGPRVFRFPVLMLATWFDESKGQTAPQFQDGSTPEKFKKVLDGFGGNPTGSLTEFYFENSYGQFLVQVDVFGPYVSQRSRQDPCYYGGIEAPEDPADDLDPLDSALGVGGGGAIGMAVEAVPQADKDVDFSKYDNDGDGFVDFTAILHSGADMAATGDPCNTWSHAIEAGLAGPLVEETVGLPHNSLHHGIPTTDGVFVDRLFTMPEMDLEIGVAAHEMAHALGEPDYYDTTYTSMGTGDWDLMAGGSWFGNPPGSNPTHFNPASKVFQGWVTPKVVTSDATDVVLRPRELSPRAGYTVKDVDPNIVLVPTKTIKVGEKDELDHTWTQDDVYGLAKAGDRYVIEGYYVENWSRSTNAAPFDPKMLRQPYFDRQALGSGLLVWHFDYYRRSNTYYGANDAGSDANRPQLDPMEFDFNDNTQELQLGTTRGEPQDLLAGAATGITSGTRLASPGIPQVTGTPQKGSTWTGVVTPAKADDHAFTVDANPANYRMRVTAKGVGDCKLQLLHDGKPFGGEVDAGSVADEEFIDVLQPAAGAWTARVSDFAACLQYDGAVTFSKPDDVFDTKGAADTWSNWTKKATGWAFTNVRPGGAEGLDTAVDAGDGTITLDLLHLAGGARDVSPGFITPGDVDAGRANAMSVPVFNNGDTPVASVEVIVKRGSAVVARGAVKDLGAYQRKAFTFSYTPAAEGPEALVATVDPSGRLAERSEANNSQRTVVEASPRGGRVLVVDDDGAADGEQTVTGALAALGIPFDVVREHADVATLKRYAAVVWEGGLERYQGQLDPDDRKAVAAYLDGGGKLLYASPRAAGALGEPPGSTNPTATDDMAPFAADYLGVEYRDTEQVGGGTVTGTGDILGSGAFAIDVFPGRPLQDVWAKAASKKGTATPIASWSKGGAGSLMGVKVQGTSGFRTVFLGFNPAQVVQGAAVTDVLGRSLSWLGVQPGGYPSGPAVLRHTSLRNAVKGAPLAVKAFTVGTTAAPVLHYRVKGAASWTTVTLARSRTGVWQATIPASAVTTRGVQYFLTAGSARDPFTADLPHFVAVA